MDYWAKMQLINAPSVKSGPRTDHNPRRTTNGRVPRPTSTNGPPATSNEQGAWHDPRPTTRTNAEGRVRVGGRGQSSSSSSSSPLFAGALRRRDRFDRGVIAMASPQYRSLARTPTPASTSSLTRGTPAPTSHP
ncbi:hypothetical protein BD410DRAFT_842353 [Rickenella mellea]|uniref:Uncharacterized protein n=1 Tax=Rickenella mellea TaxID=50990 RepID=A0A4Y7PVP0_9AGAM|nr:hypothetical protein BD410DRAFT_842353 [Rickenella mellea]